MSWKSSEFCDFSTTWECDHDPNFLSSYSVIQRDDDWDDESVNRVSSSTITFTRNDHTGTFEMNCTCKPHHGVSIIGIEVRSQVQTIELYSNMDGYLQTIKGTKIDEDDGTFCCRGKLEKSVDNLNMKFMGLGQRSSVKIYRLHFVVVQNLERSPGEGDGNTGMVNMKKVRGLLHSMGDSAPEGGTKLLQAVEEYQQSQMSQFGRLSSALGAGASDSSSVLSSLLSMVNRSHGTQQSNQNANCRSNDTEQPNQSVPNLLTDISQQKSKPPDPVTGGPLAAMLMSMSRSQDEGQGDSREEGMFEMLQNICGKVSKLRVAEHAVGAENIDVDEDTATSRSGVKTEPDIGASNGETASARVSGLDLETLQTSIEQTVCKLVEASEDRLKTYIDTRLNAIETQITLKLDSLVQLLQKNGHPLTGSEGDTLTESNAGI